MLSKPVAQEDRVRAVTEIASMAGSFLDPEELGQVIEDERMSALPIREE